MIRLIARDTYIKNTLMSTEKMIFTKKQATRSTIGVVVYYATEQITSIRNNTHAPPTVLKMKRLETIRN